ncbi:hypothetical protein [Microbacterium sp. NPDC076911]|uniref:hypothetical protein n=1 Tax=Microbacterium sp. NPDC076911 TaxID=3154958 RepID=UPI0034208D11
MDGVVATDMSVVEQILEGRDVQLIIAARADDSLIQYAHARGVTVGRVTVDDLRFVPEDVAAIAERRGIKISAASAAWATNAVAGWPSALAYFPQELTRAKQSRAKSTAAAIDAAVDHSLMLAIGPLLTPDQLSELIPNVLTDRISVRTRGNDVDELRPRFELLTALADLGLGSWRN